ncbi:hypothetical protein HOG98_04745 [bacterium]|nr:hypothetical protein [bacterium]
MSVFKIVAAMNEGVLGSGSGNDSGHIHRTHKLSKQICFSSLMRRDGEYDSDDESNHGGGSIAGSVRSKVSNLSQLSASGSGSASIFKGQDIYRNVAKSTGNSTSTKTYNSSRFETIYAFSTELNSVGSGSHVTLSEVVDLLSAYVAHQFKEEQPIAVPEKKKKSMMSGFKSLLKKTPSTEKMEPKEGRISERIRAEFKTYLASDAAPEIVKQAMVIYALKSIYDNSYEASENLPIVESFFDGSKQVNDAVHSIVTNKIGLVELGRHKNAVLLSFNIEKLGTLIKANPDLDEIKKNLKNLTNEKKGRRHVMMLALANKEFLEFSFKRMHCSPQANNEVKEKIVGLIDFIVEKMRNDKTVSLKKSNFVIEEFGRFIKKAISDSVTRGGIEEMAPVIDGNGEDVSSPSRAALESNGSANVVDMIDSFRNDRSHMLNDIITQEGALDYDRLKSESFSEKPFSNLFDVLVVLLIENSSLGLEILTESLASFQSLSGQTDCGRSVSGGHNKETSKLFTILESNSSKNQLRDEVWFSEMFKTLSDAFPNRSTGTHFDAEYERLGSSYYRMIEEGFFREFLLEARDRYQIELDKVGSKTGIDANSDVLKWSRAVNLFCSKVYKALLDDNMTPKLLHKTSVHDFLVQKLETKLSKDGSTGAIKKAKPSVNSGNSTRRVSSANQMAPITEMDSPVKQTVSVFPPQFKSPVNSRSATPVQEISVSELAKEGTPLAEMEEHDRLDVLLNTSVEDINQWTIVNLRIITNGFEASLFTKGSLNLSAPSSLNIDRLRAVLGLKNEEMSGDSIRCMLNDLSTQEVILKLPDNIINEIYAELLRNLVLDNVDSDQKEALLFRYISSKNVLNGTRPFPENVTLPLAYREALIFPTSIEDINGWALDVLENIMNSFNGEMFTKSPLNLDEPDRVDIFRLKAVLGLTNTKATPESIMNLVAKMSDVVIKKLPADVKTMIFKKLISVDEGTSHWFKLNIAKQKAVLFDCTVNGLFGITGQFFGFFGAVNLPAFKGIGISLASPTKLMFPYKGVTNVDIANINSALLSTVLSAGSEKLVSSFTSSDVTHLFNTVGTQGLSRINEELKVALTQKLNSEDFKELANSDSDQLNGNSWFQKMFLSVVTNALNAQNNGKPFYNLTHVDAAKLKTLSSECSRQVLSMLYEAEWLYSPDQVLVLFERLASSEELKKLPVEAKSGILNILKVDNLQVIGNPNLIALITGFNVFDFVTKVTGNNSEKAEFIISQLTASEISNLPFRTRLALIKPLTPEKIRNVGSGGTNGKGSSFLNGMGKKDNVKLADEISAIGLIGDDQRSALKFHYSWFNFWFTRSSEFQDKF